MLDRRDWEGVLSGVPRATASVSLVAPLRRSDSGAAAFLSLASDGNSYWCKVPGNPQGDTVLSAEQIVARAGALIEAPIRPVELLTIPPELDGWEYSQFVRLRAGTAHGSLHLPNCHEGWEDPRVADDENRHRLPLFAALWDWCMGHDEQWLFDMSTEGSLWSFDHGWWLGGGPSWDAESLERLAHRSYRWEHGVRGSDAKQYEAVADRLEAVSVDQVLSVVAGIPDDWGVDDSALESVAWVLWVRRDGVARRLRDLAHMAGR